MIKAMIIGLLLIIAVHLLLYSYLQRRIEGARREKELRDE